MVVDGGMHHVVMLNNDKIKVFIIDCLPCNDNKTIITDWQEINLNFNKL